jgi:hypothetical protein
VNPNSERCVFSKKILEKIGFTVEIVQAIPDPDKVISNKKTMQSIYHKIQTGNMYGYVFEDDVNVLEDIRLDEIIEYESISPVFFYLGMCEYGYKAVCTEHIIRNKKVFSKSNYVRGLHAIGLSKMGAKLLLEYSKTCVHRYMDMILEEFSTLYPANVVRYDLESYIKGHRGVIFQDRAKFKSEI